MLVACSDAPALGRIAAAPNCAGLDRACLEAGFDAPLAVGASVELALEVWTAPSTPPPLVLEAATDALLVEGRTITATAEGTTAVLMLDPAGEVLDLLHVWSQEPDALVLVSVAEGGQLRDVTVQDMTIGDTTDLSARFERDGTALMGMPTFHVVVEGGSVRAERVGDLVRVRAQAAGSSTVRIETDTLFTELAVEVTP